MKLFTIAAAIGVASAQLGPGSGAWETATPASVGLSDAALTDAAKAVSSAVSGRNCFLVVKQGKIVKEEYYGSSVSATNTGWSTTKSFCSSMFGVAMAQGWAEHEMKPSEKVKNSRKCNADATFRNVLTMTGTSPDISKPRFAYDTLGTDCYDTLSGFVADNNPDGTNAETWKDKHLFGPLGMEHSKWTGNDLPCGAGAELSCRDLARGAQLWLNAGAWPGHGQLMDSRHALDGTKWVYPDQGDPYGYGVRLRPGDPVDPNVAFFGGILVQCAFFSREHDAIVVSMGSDLFRNCKTAVWEQARNAVVSKDHPLWTSLNASSTLESFNFTSFTAGFNRGNVAK
jgi:CubicO group peptidase (beta-lactamase class C family)